MIVLDRSWAALVLSGFPPYDKRTHRTAASYKIEERAREPAAEGESAPGRVWNPAEVFLPEDVESGCLERRGIFLKRRNVALGWILDRAFQFTSKSGKPIVHVDVDAYTSGSQHAIDTCGTFLILSKPAAVPKCVDSHDEVEEAG